MKGLLDSLLYLVMLALFLSSLFFSFHVVTFKAALNHDISDEIRSGQTVNIQKILDGDEVVVAVGAGQLTVRLLGIVSFDPTMDDPVVSPYARQTMTYLEQSVGGKDITIVYDELKTDARGRLLAYVHAGDQDVGLDMIRKGLALSYVKYPCSRDKQYDQAQETAKTQKVGLWADPRMVTRSDQLRAVWLSERAQGE